jgi:dipeptidase E
MKLLLTSAGVRNPSINDALARLLGKPIAEANALCIPTALYGLPGGPAMAGMLINGIAPIPLCDLGWKSLGVLELTALPSIGEDRWLPAVRETDALLVSGGDPLYLSYWMRKSGLADVLPSLRDVVYVGVSAGSMVLTPDVGENVVFWKPPTDGDATFLGMVDFSIFPHLDHEQAPERSMDHAQRWAGGIPVPGYAIDDQTAIAVTDGGVEVVSEGKWKLFNSAQ